MLDTGIVGENKLKTTTKRYDKLLYKSVSNTLLTMNTSEKFCLKWNDFQTNINSTFGALREDTDFADVTLACEDGQQVEAHKVILAYSSPFFQNLLMRNKHAHPLIYMKGIKSDDLLAILDFLYHGEADVCQDNLDSFLAIAEDLKLKGLSGETQDSTTKDPPRQAYLEREDIKKEVATENTKKETHNFENNSSDVIDSNYSISETKIVLADQKVQIDLLELDEKIKSMMTSNDSLLSGGIGKGRTCKVCGKEGHRRNIMDHIEANHIEGVSHPCNFCNKTFRSRPSLRTHKKMQSHF